MSRDQEKRGQNAPANPFAVSRRGFLKGTGVAVAAAGVLGPATAAARSTATDVPIVGPGAVEFTLKINGEAKKVSAEPWTTLLDLMRNRLDLTGSKRVCDRGTCGGCTVHLDGRAINSCSILAIDCVGREITTIEGLSKGDQLHPVQAAFVECDALQCGFCTPGMVMACTAFLAKNPKPTREETAHGIAGNICRCGTYDNILDAVQVASGQGGKK